MTIVLLTTSPIKQHLQGFKGLYEKAISANKETMAWQKSKYQRDPKGLWGKHESTVGIPWDNDGTILRKQTETSGNQKENAEHPSGKHDNVIT